jgi:hypothetical protein
MIFTNDFIELGRTGNNGFTKAQMYIVANLLGETISSEYIYPKNWKERLTGMEVNDVWVTRFIKAKEYTAKHIMRMGVERCTGIPKEQAKLICNDQRMLSEKAKRKADKRKMKKDLKIAIKRLEKSMA